MDLNDLSMVLPWTNSIGKCPLCSTYFLPLLPSRIISWFTLCYSGYFFVLHLHTVQVLFTSMVLCKGPWFWSVYVSSTISDLRGESTCSNPSTQSEAHTGSPNASKTPLETRNKFRRQCPPSQRSSDASPRARSFVHHTGRERSSCAHSPATPLLRTAQDLSLPTKHSDTTSHTRTF